MNATLVPASEFFRRLAASDVKLEYADGVVSEMAGAQRNHNQLAMNLYVRMGDQSPDFDSKLLSHFGRHVHSDSRHIVLHLEDLNREAIIANVLVARIGIWVRR